MITTAFIIIPIIRTLFEFLLLKKNKNNTRSVNRVLANNGRCTYSFLSVFPRRTGIIQNVYFAAWVIVVVVVVLMHVQ